MDSLQDYDDYQLWEPKIEQDTIREGLPPEKMPKLPRHVKSVGIPRKSILEEMLKTMDATDLLYDTKRVVGGYRTYVSAKIPYPGEWFESKIVTARGDVSRDKSETLESACTSMIYTIQKELGVELNDLNWLEMKGLEIDKAKLFRENKRLRELVAKLHEGAKGSLQGWKTTLDGLDVVKQMVLNASCDGIVDEQEPEASQAVSLSKWYDLTCIHQCAEEFMTEGSTAFYERARSLKKD